MAGKVLKALQRTKGGARDNKISMNVHGVKNNSKRPGRLSPKKDDRVGGEITQKEDLLEQKRQTGNIPYEKREKYHVKNKRITKKIEHDRMDGIMVKRTHKQKERNHPPAAERGSKSASPFRGTGRPTDVIKEEQMAGAFLIKKKKDHMDHHDKSTNKNPRFQKLDLATQIRNAWIYKHMQSCQNEFTVYRKGRIFIGTWNVHRNSDEGLSLDEWLMQGCNLEKNQQHDLVVIGLQEMVDLNAVNCTYDTLSQNHSRFWVDKIRSTLNNPRYTQSDEKRSYKVVTHQYLVGLLVCIFVRKPQHKFIKYVESASLGVGIMGKGNKGGVAIRMQFYDTTICFVCSHLAAHQEQISQRNSDFWKVYEKLSFDVGVEGMGEALQGGSLRKWITGTTNLGVPDHDVIFWLGDLNYRIDDTLISTERIVQLSHEKDFKELQDLDQLNIERAKGMAFHGFKEGKLNFPPTYKYIVGRNEYDKTRSPSWCDRVLWLSQRESHVKQLSYGCSENPKVSDHRPVFSTFKLSVKEYIVEKKEALYDKLARTLGDNEFQTLTMVDIDIIDLTFKTLQADILRKQQKSDLDSELQRWINKSVKARNIQEKEKKQNNKLDRGMFGEKSSKESVLYEDRMAGQLLKNPMKRKEKKLLDRLSKSQDFGDFGMFDSSIEGPSTRRRRKHNAIDGPREITNGNSTVLMEEKLAGELLKSKNTSPKRIKSQFMKRGAVKIGAICSNTNKDKSGYLNTSSRRLHNADPRLTKSFDDVDFNVSDFAPIKSALTPRRRRRRSNDQDDPLEPKATANKSNEKRSIDRKTALHNTNPAHRKSKSFDNGDFDLSDSVPIVKRSSTRRRRSNDQDDPLEPKSTANKSSEDRSVDRETALQNTNPAHRKSKSFDSSDVCISGSVPIGTSPTTPRRRRRRSNDQDDPFEPKPATTKSGEGKSMDKETNVQDTKAVHNNSKSFDNTIHVEMSDYIALKQATVPPSRKRLDDDDYPLGHKTNTVAKSTVLKEDEMTGLTLKDRNAVTPKKMSNSSSRRQTNEVDRIPHANRKSAPPSLPLKNRFVKQTSKRQSVTKDDDDRGMFDTKLPMAHPTKADVVAEDVVAGKLMKQKKTGNFDEKMVQDLKFDYLAALATARRSSIS